MECIVCGNMIENQKICEECNNKKIKAKDGMRIGLIEIPIGIICIFIVFAITTFLKLDEDSLLYKALVNGFAVCSAISILTSPIFIIRNYVDYKYYCKIEKNDIIPKENNDGEINEDALERYLNSKKKIN